MRRAWPAKKSSAQSPKGASFEIWISQGPHRPVQRALTGVFLHSNQNLELPGRRPVFSNPGLAGTFAEPKGLLEAELPASAFAIAAPDDLIEEGLLAGAFATAAPDEADPEAEALLGTTGTWPGGVWALCGVWAGLCGRHAGCGRVWACVSGVWVCAGGA